MTYAEKQAARRDRMKDRAAKLRGESNSQYQAARRILSFIPPGQPILVDHYSAGRHRRDLARSDSHMRKSIQLDKQAEDLERRASTTNTAISSDDEEALPKLKAELDAMTQAQEKMKAANKLIKKGDREGLAALGFTAEQVEKLFQPDFCGRIGFASFSLTNNNANMKRVKLRIAVLEKAKQRRDAVASGEAEAPKPIPFDGGEVYEDLDANRVYFRFDDKPARPIIDILKSRGFKWTPSKGLWGRQLNNAARYAASEILREIKNSV